MKRTPRSILIVCLRLIGDVILATPLIGVFRETYPEAAIDLLVNRGTGEFLEKDPRIRRVLYAGNREFAGTPPGRGGGYLWDILRKYDLAATLNASDRGNIAVLLAGRRVRVGFYQGKSVLRTSWRKLLLTHPIAFPSSLHVARIGELVARALEIPISRLEARVFWDREDESRVEGFLRREGVVPPFFVVHPFARWRYKYWVADKFARVSDEIAAVYGLRPVWTSSPDPEEIGRLREAAALCRIPPALGAGEFTLNGMTCLLSKAVLYVGLDTAVSHLAATTGIPIVVLFGPTIAERWSPWNNDGLVAQQCPLPRGTQRSGKMILVQKDWPCVPCGKAGCDDQGGESLCMSEIGTEEVLCAVDLLLSRLPRG